MEVDRATVNTTSCHCSINLFDYNRYYYSASSSSAMLISNLIATAAAIINGESAHKIKEDAPKKVRADVDFIVTRSGLRVNRKHLYKYVYL